MSGREFVVVIHFLAAGLTGAVAWRTLRHRHVPGSVWFGVAMVGVATWAVSGAAEWLVGEDPVALSLLYRLDWVPIGVVAVAWLAFGLGYSGREDRVTPRRLAAVSVVPAAVALAALCHPLLLPEYAALLGPFGGAVDVLWAVEAVWDPVRLVGRAYAYLLLGVGSVLLVETLVERPVSRRGRVLLLLVVGPPWVLNALHLFVFDIQSFDPTIVGFVITGVAGLFAVGRFRLFEVPLARTRVVDALDSAVVVYGRDGGVYDFNDRAWSLLGLGSGDAGIDVRRALADSPLAIDPRPDTPLFHGGADGDRAAPGNGPGRAGTATETAVDGGTASLSTRLDGATVPVGDGADPAYVEARVSDLSDASGRPLSRVLRLYDVSDRERRKRELRSKKEFLDEFAGVVSHDVATPLNIIENKARLIEMTDDPGHAEDIYAATDRVQALIDQMETLARQGRGAGDTGPVELETIAREAWHGVETGSRSATLTVDTSGTVEADRDRLRQLLENLFRNSIVHGSTGRPDSEGPPADGDDPATAVLVGTVPEGFYVADDGPGIPESDRERVFEQGFSSREDGTGLGLAIVRRIAEGHGWSVSVTDSDSGGARFEVRTDG